MLEGYIHNWRHSSEVSRQPELFKWHMAQGQGTYVEHMAQGQGTYVQLATYFECH